MQRDILKIRFSKEEKAKVQLLADLYADGNFSKWVRWAAVNAPRKFLGKKKGKRPTREVPSPSPNT